MRYGKILLALLLVGSMVGITNNGVMRLLRLRDRVHKVERENAGLVRKNRDLVREIGQLKDPRTLERLIRSDLGFARDDELLFEFGNNEEHRPKSP